MESNEEKEEAVTKKGVSPTAFLVGGIAIIGLIVGLVVFTGDDVRVGSNTSERFSLTHTDGTNELIRYLEYAQDGDLDRDSCRSALRVIRIMDDSEIRPPHESVAREWDRLLRESKSLFEDCNDSNFDEVLDTMGDLYDEMVRVGDPGYQEG